MTNQQRTIPAGTVWKYIYEVSHAPHYVQQLANGVFVGIFAPVENVHRENSIPFGVPEERLWEDKRSDHVTVREHEKSASPFAEGVYFDQEIPDGVVWKFDMDDEGKPHYVQQLANGTFIFMYGNDPDQVPNGLAKEKVMSKRQEENVDVEAIDKRESPFAARFE